MHARLLRPALGLALVSTGVLALGAAAAPAPTVIEDIAGDANLLNTQIVNHPAAGNGVAGPGTQAGLDILKVELKNTFAPAAKKSKTPPACTGFTVKMTLSGPPAGDSRFRLSADTEVNTDFFIIEHDTGTGETSIRYGGPGEDETMLIKGAVVAGSTITWNVTSKQVKSLGEEPGAVMSALLATTTASVEGLLFFPIFDKVSGGDKTFTICG
jgi:hypothetical protein